MKFRERGEGGSKDILERMVGQGLLGCEGDEAEGMIAVRTDVPWGPFLVS